MNLHSTVIVSNTDKPKAQEVINELYSSEAGIEFFGVELKEGLNTYWASSGPFHNPELTALINSGFAYHVNIGDKFGEVLEGLLLTKVVTNQDL